MWHYFAEISSAQTRGIIKTSGSTRGVCKSGDYIKVKVFKIYGVPREQALLRKSKTQKIARKSTLSD